MEFSNNSKKVFFCFDGYSKNSLKTNVNKVLIWFQSKM